ncbi:MAG: triose-phosphate isomerase [Planctomycetota bacterium]
MSRTPYVAGNWKMNLHTADGVALAEKVAIDRPDGMDVGVAPPFPYLAKIAEIGGGRLHVGAQDVHHEDVGAFTGEVSAGMLRDVGCDFVIVGHSERRHIIGEPTELVAKKAAAVYRAGMTLIHCVGETIDERRDDATLSIVESQLAELSPAIDDPARLVIAYEPVWAIGTGETATPEQAQEVHAFIRKELAEAYGDDFAAAVRIQYGGSMKPGNAAELIAQPDIDGGLIGGASLKPDDFLAICKAAVG